MTIKMLINLLIAALFLVIGIAIGEIISHLMFRASMREVFGDLWTEEDEDDD